MRLSLGRKEAGNQLSHGNDINIEILTFEQIIRRIGIFKNEFTTGYILDLEIL